MQSILEGGCSFYVVNSATVTLRRDKSYIMFSINLNTRRVLL